MSVQNYILSSVPAWIQKYTISKNELTLYVYPEYIVPFLYFLRDHTRVEHKLLMDLTATDFTNQEKRFEVVYNLLSVRYSTRIRVKTCIDQVTPIESCIDVYKSANWFEREICDMFGIFFTNHPDLRRILTDYGFNGYPLRKDFPLTGFFEVRYDDTRKRVISEPLELTQEFRYFSFQSPWELIPKEK